MKDMRLESKDREIVQRLRGATELQQRHIAIAAAEWALRSNQLNDAELNSAVKDIQEGGAHSPATKLMLEGLVEKLDDEYFQAQDEGAAEAEFVQIFSKARAVSALLFAGNADSFVAAAEAIYEASVATEDEAPLFELTRAFLSQ